MEIDKLIPKTNSTEIIIAKFISYLLHPLLMPTYGFVLLLYTKKHISTFASKENFFFFILIIFVFTFFLPAFNAFILLRMKRINSLEMTTSKERIVPYISTSLYYFSLFYLFYTNHISDSFTVLILGSAISILLLLIINFKWKISAHATGIGGIIGAVLGISYQFKIDLLLILFIPIALAGAVGYARLKLNAHSPAQLYSGFLLGFLVEFILMMVY